MQNFQGVVKFGENPTNIVVKYGSVSANTLVPPLHAAKRPIKRMTQPAGPIPLVYLLRPSRHLLFF